MIKHTAPNIVKLGLHVWLKLGWSGDADAKCKRMNYCQPQHSRAQTSPLCLLSLRLKVLLLLQLLKFLQQSSHILQQYVTIYRNWLQYCIKYSVIYYFKFNIACFKNLDYFRCQYSGEAVVKVGSVIIPHPMSHNRVPTSRHLSLTATRECSCKFASDKQILQ